MDKRIKTIIFVMIDFLSIFISMFLSLTLLRYDVPMAIAQNYLYLTAGVLLAIMINVAFDLYSKLWKYVSVEDAIKIFGAVAIIGVYEAFVAYISPMLSIEWAIISTFFYFLFLFGSRFIFRFYQFIEKSNSKSTDKSRVMFVGAGDTTDILLREIFNSPAGDNLYPVCAVDDDKAKLKLSIKGVPIIGTTKDIVKIADDYRIDEIIVSMPSVSRKIVGGIIKECQKTKCKVRVVPSLEKLTTGKVSVSDIKSVDVCDLLGREEIVVNSREIMEYIENKVVMVTGGGGSIGSELCRQIAKHFPKKLIILDIYENNAYDIQQELKSVYPDLDLEVLIASVRDDKKIDSVFKKYKPEIVFHAAAHKHVPLMEDSPNEAIKNNVHGTFNVASCAGKYKAKRFVLISTDKAVNPTNIMGASKRICEMIIQSLDKKYAETEFVAVRFGNVLGSNGSVIPLFEKQIKNGGPITVTHKDIVRYFMTIPEAVSLVLQAGAYAKGGEIFVLDMGEPVKIYDLAINLIKLSGLEPFKDIDVMITGLRPGEKLYEERLMKEEGLLKTANSMISIGKPIEFDEETFIDDINELYKKATEENDDMKYLVKKLVPTYTVYEGKGKQGK